MILVNTAYTEIICPFCQKKVPGNRCNDCFGTPIFAPLFHYKELTEQGYGFRAFEEILFWIPKGDFVYRINYYPHLINDKYKASLFAHVSGTYDTYTIVKNISVTELTPDNIEPLLNRYLKLKAFL